MKTLLARNRCDWNKASQTHSFLWILCFCLCFHISSVAEIQQNEIRQASAKLKSIHLSASQRYQALNSFINLVRVRGASGNEAEIRKVIKEQLENFGAQEWKLSTEQSAPINLVMVVPASPEFKGKPGILLNAHMDTIAQSSPEFLRFDKDRSEFYHLHDDIDSKNSSFGGDDRTGVACLTESIRILHENHWSKGQPHRKIILVFTADEERGLKGAKYLTQHHPDVFDNLDWSITIDGPLDFHIKYPEYSIVAVVADSDRNRYPYNKIIQFAHNYCDKSDQRLALTRFGLGMGDFAAFPEKARAGLHFRSPVRGFHNKERVLMQDLINHIDLVCHLVLEWDSGAN